MFENIKPIKLIKIIVSVSCHCSRRTFSSNKYRSSINLPNTQFVLSMKNSSVEEKRIQQICEFERLYQWQQEQTREKRFVLHDGPPYANGEPHVGHALNKILKDITNRRKLLEGYKVHYVPGWDCHGMPIEQKALASIRADHTTMEPRDIRKTAEAFAEKTIEKQMEAFKRWGVMADWRKCYYTFDKEFEAHQLDVFFQMYDKGLIYQDYMPVHWSPSARTALAEAELEYNDHHISKSVYVKFKLCDIPQELRQHTGSSDVYAVIWTTTPWTLPANQAICYGRGIRYSLVQLEDSADFYITSTDFVQRFSDLMESGVRSLSTFQGSGLEGGTYVHPLKGSHVIYPLLEAHHVTTEKGTGLVHTAPAHGSDDFQIAINHRLPLECDVDEGGCYTDAADTRLAGKYVLTDGNQTVLSLLENNIIHQEEFTHSYPYDWRTKQPCILRASKQWFVDTSKIKQEALDCLNGVRITPAASGRGMQSMLEKRTYWCISRQRAWGVPIPVFYKQSSGDVLLSSASMAHVRELVAEHGTDCWWSLPIDTLLPPHIKQKSGFKADDVFLKGSDVLDIWFDSGTTWASVLKDTDYTSDVYLEGLDQFGGWFQSSLLTSVAAQHRAPYKSLVVHGFVVDEEGRKMSKSIGNVIDPNTVISGGKDLKKEPAYGADVLRWWVAAAGLESRVRIGPNAIDQCLYQLYSIRKSLRYLLGNLYDFETDTKLVDYHDLLPTDKYMLHLLYELIGQVNEAYDQFRYDQVVRLCDLFVATRVSAFYSTVTKDRMYCSHASEEGRHAGQTVQYYVLKSLIQCLAPIVPHLCEELYQHHPFKSEGVTSVFKTLLLEPDQCWKNDLLKNVFTSAFCVRDMFRKTVSPMGPVDFDVIVCAEDSLLNDLKLLQEEETSHHSSLCEVMQASTTSLLHGPPPTCRDQSQTTVHGTCDGIEKSEFHLIVTKAKHFICERCRRYTAEKYGTPCNRCMDVLSTGWE